MKQVKPIKKTGRGILENRFVYFLIFGVAALLMFVPLFYKDQLESFKSLGILGIFFINLIGSATIFLPTPAILAVGIGAKLYNPVVVALVAAIGSSVGDSLGLIFGYASKEVLDIKTHPLLSYLGHYFLKKYGSFILFLFAFIPNPIFDGMGIVAGLAGYSPVRFILITFCGRFLRNLLIAYAILSF